MLLFVRIKPNQRFDKLEKVADHWQIHLKAPAQDGLANERLIAFLAKVLALAKSDISIKSGQKARNKYLKIDADEDYVEQKLKLSENK